MNIQFKKGALDLCVLVLLAKEDRYGYELVQKISNRVAISEGSVYPLLRRLTKEGYFTTYLQESAGGPPRKYYSLTDAGKEYLAEQLKEWKSFTEGVNQLIEEGTEHDGTAFSE
ncbi:PadR family transcriptional regulator [Indiicoccus explosivorum]|uniref:PadR family transcriptional regulator n=1 Tax=Indiicoccus explosivorum TaxID=1917864 RepID=UPI000B4303F8|nr:PadR family transcriptional regulator [Indiicoccus explosivorum]